MKYLVSFAMFIAVSVVSIGQPWHTYATDEGKFFIDFPSSYVEDVSEIGNYKITAETGSTVYMASFMIHEGSDDDPYGLAEVSLASFTEAVGGKVQKQKKWKYKGTKGVDSQIQFVQDGMTATVLYKVIIINNIQYQLVFLTLEDDYDEKTVKQFFKSFKIEMS